MVLADEPLRGTGDPPREISRGSGGGVIYPPPPPGPAQALTPGPSWQRVRLTPVWRRLVSTSPPGHPPSTVNSEVATLRGGAGRGEDPPPSPLGCPVWVAGLHGASPFRRAAYNTVRLDIRSLLLLRPSCHFEKKHCFRELLSREDPQSSLLSLLKKRMGSPETARKSFHE